MTPYATPKLRTITLSLSFLVLAVAAGDCSGQDAKPGIVPRDVVEGPHACDNNTECAGGEICRDGTCRTACAESTECQATAPVCDPVLGYCVLCLQDADCDHDEACVADACVFHCRSDAACDASEFCDVALGTCSAKECTQNADCPGGQRCQTFVCVPIDAIVCEAGSRSCLEGENTLRTCAADGTSFSDAPCGPDAVCAAAAGAPAACQPIVCAPFEAGCLTPDTAFVCDATGTEETPLPCGPDQYCDLGSCRAQVCVPDTAACDGNTVVTCNATGDHASVTPCADTSACAESAFGCTCREAVCHTRVCVPDSARCVGSGTQACAPDGLAYGDIVPCDADAVCVAGQCLPRACVPNERTCAGDTLLVCDALGTDRTTTDCAAADQICTGSGPTAACTARVCTPNAAACDPTASAVIACDARGAVETTTPCAPAQYCDGASCRAQACAPNSVVCDGNAVVTCDGLGADATVVPCGSPGACPDGAFACTCVDGACTPGVCAPASVRCVGNGVQTCSADGLAYGAIVACGDAEVCSDGACVPRQCTPSALRCDGDTLVACNANGTAETGTSCQASQSYCAASGGSAACVPWACTPNVVTCDATGMGLMVCDARGTGQTPTPCGTGEYCDAGTCHGQVCTPGATTCNAAATAVLTCDGRGATQTPTPCNAAQYCDGGTCHAQICTPNGSTCNGAQTAVLLCDSRGASQTSTSCGAGRYCAGGVCNDQVCEPASVTCGACVPTFSDDFESGDLTKWDGFFGTSPTLTVSAPISGNYSLRATYGIQNMILKSFAPLPAARVSMRIDAHGVNTPGGTTVYPIVDMDDIAGDSFPFSLWLGRVGGQARIAVRIHVAAGAGPELDWTPVPDAFTLRIEWASGAGGTGFARIFVDEQRIGNFPGLSNGADRFDALHIGYGGASEGTGPVKFDDVIVDTCLDDTLVTCDALGASVTTSPCAQQPACAANADGCTCQSGACLTRVCAPESGRCVGNNREICSPTGLAWGDPSPCDDGYVCGDGLCYVPCTPNAATCDGETLVSCNAAGTSETRTDCMSDYGFCAVTCGCEAQTGLLAWYDFESEANDQSGNGRDGIPSKSLTYVTAVRGQGISLDGSTSVTLPNSLVLGPTTTRSRTISMWLDADSARDTFISQYRNLEPSKSSFLISAVSGGGLAAVANGTTLNGISTLTYTPSPSLSGWHHWTVVFSSGANNTAIYLDGVEKARGTLPYSSAESPYAPVIGQLPGTQGHYFTGGLDDLKVFDHVLTPSEIANLAGTCVP